MSKPAFDPILNIKKTPPTIKGRIQSIPRYHPNSYAKTRSHKHLVSMHNAHTTSVPTIKTGSELLLLWEIQLLPELKEVFSQRLLLSERN